MFLPFVHRIGADLAAYRERPLWLTVGEVLEPARPAAVPGQVRTAPSRMVLTPAGARVGLDGEGPDVVELQEQGFYEIRPQGRDGAAPVVVASNVDLAESDLAAMEPGDVVAGATGRAGGAAAGASATATDQEHERNQRLWWYLLFAGFLLLALETVIGNRQSRGGAIRV